MGIKRASAIYTIINEESGKLYVGKSKNVKERKYKHFDNLEKGKHSNPHLQNSYDVHGRDAFVFEVLEYCDQSNLTQREQYWMDELNVIDGEHGYNIIPDARRSQLSEETKKKISESLKGIEFSEERCKNISEALTGIEFSDERRKNLSEAHQGREMNEETKQKISEANKGNEKLIESHKGKTLSEEHKKKIGESVEGMEMPEEAKQKISESQTGNNNHQSKIDESTAHEIVDQLRNTNKMQNQIAESLDVPVGVVRSINSGECWDHVQPEVGRAIREGVTMNERARKRMSEASKGFTHDEETKEKLSKANKGKNSDLNEQKVRELKKGLLEGEKTQYELADEYDMTQAAVSAIKRGESWSHVEVEGDDELQDTQNKKLDKRDVKTIKWFLEYSNLTQETIAEKYGVSQSTIYMINTGKNWSHVSIS
jgi:group I intron endonuclease